MRVFEAKGFPSKEGSRPFVSISPDWPTGAHDEDGLAEGSHVGVELYASISAAEDLLAQLPDAIAKAKGIAYDPVDVAALQAENAMLRKLVETLRPTTEEAVTNEGAK